MINSILSSLLYPKKRRRSRLPIMGLLDMVRSMSKAEYHDFQEAAYRMQALHHGLYGKSISWSSRRKLWIRSPITEAEYKRLRDERNGIRKKYPGITGCLTF